MIDEYVQNNKIVFRRRPNYAIRIISVGFRCGEDTNIDGCE